MSKESQLIKENTPPKLFALTVLLIQVSSVFSSVFGAVLLIVSLKYNNKHFFACLIALATLAYNIFILYFYDPEQMANKYALNYLWGVFLSIIIYKNGPVTKEQESNFFSLGMIGSLFFFLDLMSSLSPVNRFPEVSNQFLYGTDLDSATLTLELIILTFFLFSKKASLLFYNLCVIFYAVFAFISIIPGNADGDYFIDRDDACPYAPSDYDCGCPGIGESIANIHMVFVKGGTFVMGDDNSDNPREKPAHKVTLNDYFIGNVEVTETQWTEIMGQDSTQRYFCGACPIANVSWNEAQVFIQKLNAKTGKKYRLPTDAEWEYAAKGGVKSRNKKYAGSNNVDRVAWYTFNAKDERGSHLSESHMNVQPVGRKQPNELGIYDMSGNVSEFCQDGFGPYPKEDVKNPKGVKNDDSKILRGGSFLSGKYYAKNSFRGLVDPDYKDIQFGFRLAMDY